MLLLGKRIFIHPSISTFNNVMNVGGTKSLKQSKLYLNKLSLRMRTDV